nr:hypothetical protein [Cupriavidus sp. YR651]
MQHALDGAIGGEAIRAAVRRRIASTHLEGTNLRAPSSFRSRVTPIGCGRMP